MVDRECSRDLPGGFQGNRCRGDPDADRHPLGLCAAVFRTAAWSAVAVSRDCLKGEELARGPGPVGAPPLPWQRRCPHGHHALTCCAIYLFISNIVTLSRPNTFFSLSS